MLKLVVLAVVVAVAVADTCCTPMQWMSRYGSITGTVTAGTSNTMEVNGQIAYDYTNKKTAVSMEYTVDSMTVSNRTIVDYNKKLVYMINKDNACSVSMADKPMMEACVPTGSKEMGEFYFGLSTMLDAKAYGFEMPVAGGKVEGVVTLTKAECAPITEIVYGTIGETKMMTTVGFVDIMPLDSSAFDIPAGCDDKKPSKTPMKLSSSLFGIPHAN